MPARYPSQMPTVWLMTDERQGDALWSALRHLPPGSGVVFRHRRTPGRERHRLWLRVRRIAHARGLLIVSAGRLPGADGMHGGRGALTWPAHDRGQAIAASRAGAALVFVSPIFHTRSHPGDPALGPMRAARVARGLGLMVVALGGMDRRRFRRIAALGFDGWAAIDALTPRPSSPRP